jgi:hypothetical protein
MAAFVDGYNAFAKNAGANIAAFGGADYVGTVETAIGELAAAINNPGRKIDKASLDSVKGFIAEKWHAGTFNVDAAVKGLSARASAIDDNSVVDIATSWGSNYQSKVNAKAQNSVNQLAVTNEAHANYSGDNPGGLYYDGQFGLVAADKFDEIQRLLERRIMRNSEIRPDVAANSQQLLDNLTDRINGSGGTQSTPLAEAEARQLAQLAKEENFDPAEWGIATTELIGAEEILSQAFQAGLSAAVISIVLQVAPELISIITNLIRDGELDVDDFKRVGFAALEGGSLGFVRGSVASALTIACQAGKLGAALRGANPTVIGAMVALTMNTLQNATLMAFGKMTSKEFSNQCIQDLFITVSSLALGSVLQALLPELPVLGFMLGSFIGSVVGSFVYKTGYSCVMSFCVDTGCTFFGLVEQDYTLPDDVLEEIGINVFEYEKFVPNQIEPKKFEPNRFEAKSFTANSIDIVFLRRGVIGVNCVGYL